MKMHLKNPRTTPLAGSFALMLAIVAVAAHAGQPPNVQERADARTEDRLQDFQRQDIDGDGAVSLAEFLTDRHPERAFQDADEDHDHRLSQDEYVKARAIGDRFAVGDYIDDAWITAKIKSTLVREQHLEGLQIGVETYDGVVQLHGWVDHARQAAAAADIARDVDGVRRVLNNIQVKG